MIATDPYPYLSHLLSAFFHQDAFDDGETSDDVLRDFRRVAQPYEATGVQADIERFLHQNSEKLLRSFEHTFHPDLILANSDDELRAWLNHALSVLGGTST